ncbi:MAG: hypothetical protein IT440_13130 [Phycisphaeraceae bacterium]|nr:hypothetical protein [Phycisphaeraceae bacterium]
MIIACLILMVASVTVGLVGFMMLFGKQVEALQREGPARNWRVALILVPYGIGTLAEMATRWSRKSDRRETLLITTGAIGFLLCILLLRMA